VERFVEDVDIAKVLTAASVLTKARVVGYPADGPRTALHKMRDENYSSLLVVERDYRLRGMVTVDDVELALKDGKRTLGEILQGDIPVKKADTPLTELFQVLSEYPGPLPIVDDKQCLLGVVLRAAVLEALAHAPNSSSEAPVSSVVQESEHA
jgi:glycine betaine/proline transport system ATP-binding protein